MAYERMGDSPLEYYPCRYRGSKLRFRGPKRELQGRFVAFLGGTETYGKFIEQPYPALIEARTGVKCVNFGWPNAGVDVFLNDPGVLSATQEACLTVLQVPCVQNMSNRFYAVHPRRNDRFLEASGTLRAVYGEVDFTEFHFVRHMLHHLQTVSPDRFRMVREEIQTAWVSRMQLLLEQIGGKTLLLWLSARAPEQNANQTDVAYDPSFVTRQMIEKLQSSANHLVEVTASDHAMAQGTKGMKFAEVEESAAKELLGPCAHYEAAEALGPLITELIGS